MTREEAIRELKIQFVGEYDRQREAKDMAIKALEQEPCDDCVSRQAVNTLVDELARAISDERSFVSRGRDTATIMQDILDLPSVLPKREQGEWILNENQGIQAVGYLTYHCSECGREICSKYHGKISLLEEYPYCHCGAKMGETQDNEWENTKNMLFPPEMRK